MEVRIHTHGTWHDFPDFAGFELRFSKLAIAGDTGDLSNLHSYGVEEELLVIRIWVHFDP